MTRPATPTRGLGTLAMLEAASTKAEELGIAVAIVVVDPAGNVRGQLAMEGAYLSAPTLAFKKAFTAINFRLPTHEMGERIQPLEYQSLVVAADERLTFIMGGLPLPASDGGWLGAIGASGGTGEQDLLCCEAAAAAVMSGPERAP